MKKQNRFTIVRKCDIAKGGPANITKSKKMQTRKAMILTKDLSLERLCFRIREMTSMWYLN